MNLPSREDLKALIGNHQRWCVSIYMPSHRTSPQTRQDPIRFKNHLREAEEKLETAGLRSSEARRLMDPAWQLIDEKPFWQHQAGGLAAFISSDLFLYYSLPLTFAELSVVTDRFHLKPLLPLFGHEGRFYILALSQNDVRLFQCNRYGFLERNLGDIPRSLSEALRYDSPQKHLQFHTKAPQAGGERAAMFHGQGAGKDEAKEDILRFFQVLNEGLHSLLGTDTAPLVLAGVEYLLPIYRIASSYKYLAEKAIIGNPDGMKGEELHEKARGIVEPSFLTAREDDLNVYYQLAGSDRSSKDPEKIVPEAYFGRVDKLFAAVGVQRWGVFDSDNRTAQFHHEPDPGDEDLLDFAAVHTYINGGRVHVLRLEEMPDESILSAVFRY